MAPPLATARLRQQLRQRVVDALRDQIDVGEGVEVAQQPVVEASVVRHDRHGECVVLRQEGQGEQILQSPAEDVQRELRAGDVGHQQVEQARGELQPGCLGQDRRWRQFIDGGQCGRAHRLL